MLPDPVPVYAAFALLSALPFLLASVRVAILIVVLGGWLLLPVGAYPEPSYETTFPFWIIGIALPSDMLLTKAWVVPAVALFWAVLFDGRRLGELRPSVLDLPLVLFCLWPLIAAGHWTDPDPSAAIAALYLAGSWAVLWLLGRVWFADAAGQARLLQGLALAGAACLPVALLEIQEGGSLYELLYREHPYGREGRVRRYLFRPVGAFEHGNQYGIWTSLCALAAVWVAVTRSGIAQRLLWIAVALIALGIGILHQSRGAVLLLLAGLVLLALWRLRLPGLLLILGIVAGIAFLGLHYSGAALDWLMAQGIVPRDALVRGGTGARQVRELLAGTGLTTFAYRLWTDYQTLDLALAAPWFGHGHWDWWRLADTRPWGFPVLAAGQFGAIAALSALSILLLAPLRAVWRLGKASAFRVETPGIALSVIVLLALVDATQNSFLFFPALLGAGALVGRRALPAAA
jgi:hypothetical protein